jgi:hypothetical protein
MLRRSIFIVSGMAYKRLYPALSLDYSDIELAQLLQI